MRDLKGPWLMYDDEKDPYQLENLIGKGNPEEGKLDALLKEKLAAGKDEFGMGIITWRNGGIRIGWGRTGHFHGALGFGGGEGAGGVAAHVDGVPGQAPAEGAG